MQSFRHLDGADITLVHAQIGGKLDSAAVIDQSIITLNLTIVPVQQALPLYKLSITEKVVQAVQSMLLPQEGSLSIHTSLPATGDGSSPVMAAVRLLAEIRSRLVFLGLEPGGIPL